MVYQPARSQTPITTFVQPTLSHSHSFSRFAKRTRHSGAEVWRRPGAVFKAKIHFRALVMQSSSCYLTPTSLSSIHSTRKLFGKLLLVSNSIDRHSSECEVLRDYWFLCLARKPRGFERKQTHTSMDTSGQQLNKRQTRLFL